MKSRSVAVTAGIAVLAGIGIGLLARHLNSGPTDLGNRALAHTSAILAHGPRPPASEALGRVRSYLAGSLNQAAWSVRVDEFDRTTPAGRLPFANVRARFGDDAAWTTPVDLLLGCHIDSKRISGIEFLGADDAASAAGAILVIAEELARDPDRANRVELIFFDGEEAFGDEITPVDGLYGSRQYARDLRTWDPLPRHGIILDMIGHRNLKIAIPSDTPRELREQLFEAARLEDAGDHFGVAPAPIIDDHVPLNQAGVPTIDIIGDFKRGGWWHTERDNANLLSEESLDISIRVTLRLIDQLLR
jgi:glutaminyl-peptide cyclotransferase